MRERDEGERECRSARDMAVGWWGQGVEGGVFSNIMPSLWSVWLSSSALCFACDPGLSL